MVSGRENSLLVQAWWIRASAHSIGSMRARLPPYDQCDRVHENNSPFRNRPPGLRISGWDRRLAGPTFSLASDLGLVSLVTAATVLPLLCGKT